MLSDGWARIKVAMFDDTISMLLKKPFHDMVAVDGFNDKLHLPDPILRLRGERRFFVLKPQREQYSNTPKFVVKEVLDMDVFETPLAIEAAPFDTPEPQRPQEHLTPSAFDTPQPSTPQDQTTTIEDVSPTSTKRKLDFSKGHFKICVYFIY